MSNYFNTLPLREKLNQLGVCDFMDSNEFLDGVSALKGKKTSNCRMWRTGLKPGFKFKR